MKARASGSGATKKRWMRAVAQALLSPPKGRAELGGGGIIPCGTKLYQTKSSEDELGYRDISTYDSTQYVGLITGVFGFGLAVPITVASTPTGYSFSGGIPVCTDDSVCANGQPKKHLVSVSGEVKISPEPDELTYTYTVDLTCGGVLTCTESGTFSGKRKDYSATRKGGTPGSPTGVFYGAQTWSVVCCADRHVP